MKIMAKALLPIMLSLGLASPAAAARIKLEIQFGSDAFEAVEDLPETPPFKVDGRYVDLGYHYRIWSVNRIPFWAWPGEGYVLYVDDFRIDTAYKVTPDVEARLIGELGHDPRGTHRFNILWYVWGWAMVGFVVWVGYLVHRERLKSERQPPPA